MKLTAFLPVTKITLLTLLLFLFIYSSCKKDHGTNPETKLYKLTYQLNDFSTVDTAFEKSVQATSGIMNINAVAPSSVMDVLYCSIYDATGKNVNTIKQLSKDASFGTITANLPAGNYTIVFAGGKTGLVLVNTLSQDKGTLNTDVLTYNNITPSGFADYAIRDTYYKKITITVGSDNSQSVTLSRIVAQLNIIIKDAIPPASSIFSVNLFLIKKKPWYDKFQVNGEDVETGTSDELRDTVPVAKLGTSNYSIKTLIFTNSTPFELEINAYHNVPNSIVPQWVAGIKLLNITASVNKNTVVSTRLFDHLGDPSVTPVLTH